MSSLILKVFWKRNVLIFQGLEIFIKGFNETWEFLQGKMETCWQLDCNTDKCTINTTLLYILEKGLD